ncbi:hypothetical protein H5410_063062 [Solanum commersonii]|uniref:Uncharacterized protein n=1 Tax=Solanum commersonii TaxID=4109 RepID=A0A9J5WE61_SOLCO|nr:hypothetical protein H5410_063062 [Solanum commersonii]
MVWAFAQEWPKEPSMDPHEEPSILDPQQGPIDQYLALQSWSYQEPTMDPPKELLILDPQLFPTKEPLAPQSWSHEAFLLVLFSIKANFTFVLGMAKDEEWEEICVCLDIRDRMALLLSVSLSN